MFILWRSVRVVKHQEGENESSHGELPWCEKWFVEQKEVTQEEGEGTALQQMHTLLQNLQRQFEEDQP